MPQRTGVAALLAALLLLAACGGSAEPTSKPSASSSASPSGTPATSPSTVPAGPAARCRVRGFVPSHRVELRSQRRLAIYVSGLRLAARTGVRGPTRLQRIVDVAPGVRLVSPEGTEVPPAVLRAVGTTVAGASTAPLPGEFFVRRRARNGSDAERRYAQYAAARVYRGTWSARLCGGRANDGTSVTVVRGTYVGVGRFGSGVRSCARVRAGRTALDVGLAVGCD